MGKKRVKKSAEVKPTSLHQPSQLNDKWMVAGLILLGLGLWWHTKELPYYWDSAGYLIHSARNILANHFSSLVGWQLFYAHPPLITATLAGLWYVFGESLMISHLVMLFFYIVLLVSSFYLAKNLLPAPMALLIAILVGITPVILAETGVVYVDMPMGALVTASLALWIRQKYLWAGIILALAVLTKLPAITIVGVYAFDWWWRIRKTGKNRTALFGLGVVLLVFLSWLLYHYHQTGWWIIKPDIDARVFQRTLMDRIQLLKFICYTIGFEQGRWLVSIPGLMGLGLILSRKNFGVLVKPQFLPLCLFVLGSTFFYTMMTEFGMRYAIYILPSLLVIMTFLIAYGFNFKAAYLALILAGVTFSLSLKPTMPPLTNYSFTPPSDLRYLDMTDAFQQLGSHFNQGSAQTIYGSFPENLYLTEPFQGYVSRATAFTECKQIKKINMGDYIVFHPLSPGQQVCLEILHRLPTIRLKRFEKNGYWIELFQVSEKGATLSAY